MGAFKIGGRFQITGRYSQTSRPLHASGLTVLDLPLTYTH
jgi:hypothetical protein